MAQVDRGWTIRRPASIPLQLAFLNGEIMHLHVWTYWSVKDMKQHIMTCQHQAPWLTWDAIQLVRDGSALDNWRCADDTDLHLQADEILTVAIMDPCSSEDEDCDANDT